MTTGWVMNVCVEKCVIVRKWRELVDDPCVRVCVCACECECGDTLAIQCVLILTCNATWYSTPLVSCLSSMCIGIAIGEIESLRSRNACILMTNPYQYFSSPLAQSH